MTSLESALKSSRYVASTTYCIINAFNVAQVLNLAEQRWRTFVARIRWWDPRRA